MERGIGWGGLYVQYESIRVGERKREGEKEEAKSRRERNRRRDKEHGIGSQIQHGIKKLLHTTTVQCLI